MMGQKKIRAVCTVGLAVLLLAVRFQNNWADLLTAALWPPLVAWGLYDSRRLSHWKFMASVGIVAGILPVPPFKWGHVLEWHWAAGAMISLILAFAFDWWRKNRKRVTEMLGGKALALRAKMVRAMRQLTPRPMLPQPVPVRI
jgi:hypothetical protein